MGPQAAATRVVDHRGNEDDDNWRFRQPKPAHSTHRHPGPPTKLHRWRAVRGATHARLWQRGAWEDDARHGISRARGDAILRAGRIHDVRGKCSRTTANLRSLGFDLAKLAVQKKIVLDHVHIERSEIEETGEYDLEGLFIRLVHAIESIGAKRVVLDTVEAHFAAPRRFFRWPRDRGMTAVITRERSENSLTHYGPEDYVADCVIILDQQIQEQISALQLLGAADHFAAARSPSLRGATPRQAHRRRALRISK